MDLGLGVGECRLKGVKKLAIATQSKTHCQLQALVLTVTFKKGKRQEKNRKLKSLSVLMS